MTYVFLDKPIDFTGQISLQEQYLCYQEPCEEERMPSQMNSKLHGVCHYRNVNIRSLLEHFCQLSSRPNSFLICSSSFAQCQTIVFPSRMCLLSVAYQPRKLASQILVLPVKCVMFSQYGLFTSKSTYFARSNSDDQSWQSKRLVIHLYM